jgi:enoyl-CoA hydratase/carnithine racemase
MVLRAKHISGPEALRIGLVNEVWPMDELKQKAAEWAQVRALCIKAFMATGTPIRIFKKWISNPLTNGKKNLTSTTRTYVP